MKMVSKIKILFLIIFLAAAPAIVKAQSHFDETEDGGDICDTPVDGGVALLLIAGLGFGALKIYKVTTAAKLNKAL